MACLVIEDSNLTVQIAALRRALGEVLGGEGPCTVGAIGLPCLPSQRTSLNTFLDRFYDDPQLIKAGRAAARLGPMSELGQPLTESEVRTRPVARVGLPSSTDILPVPA